MTINQPSQVQHIVAESWAARIATIAICNDQVTEFIATLEKLFSLGVSISSVAQK
jgi:hypothetical protein